MDADLCMGCDADTSEVPMLPSVSFRASDAHLPENKTSQEPGGKRKRLEIQDGQSGQASGGDEQAEGFNGAEIADVRKRMQDTYMMLANVTKQTIILDRGE